jgi:hypothetical protein
LRRCLNSSRNRHCESFYCSQLLLRWRLVVIVNTQLHAYCSRNAYKDVVQNDAIMTFYSTDTII